MNLVVNAREAMPSGGVLTIETDETEVDDSFLQTHSELSPGLYALVAVTDNGIGMPQNLIENIFEPFFTTKESGSGLGLATVYGIVQQNGGTVTVYSEPDNGTTFRIYLPLISRECAEEEPDVSLPLAVKCAQSGERIIIVEDDDIVRQLAMDMLVNLGYEVVGFRSAEDARPELINNDFDLLLTDVVMPGASGVELVTSLQELNPDFNVLYMSGYTESSILHRGALSGEVALIPKPFTLTQLSEKVREVLDSRCV
jgi:CheY-like chemotaxis protein